MKLRSRFGALVAPLMLSAAAVACGGGGGNSGPPASPTTPSNPADTATTITIRADGTVFPKEVRVDVGQVVRFVNEDTRAHHPQSNPHLQHTDCPAINSVGVLAAGQSRSTGALTAEKACGFHDHMNPDAPGLAGTIRVAGAEGPPGPIYIRP